MNIRPDRTLSFLIVSLGPLSACSMSVDHPSLAPRAAERFDVVAPSAPPAAPVIPANASQQQRIAALVAQAHDGDAKFQAQVDRAGAVLGGGAGAAPGGEAWVQAQQAVSRADALRNPVVQSLADLDTLQIVAARGGEDAEALFGPAISDVSAIDARQREAITALEARLSLP